MACDDAAYPIKVLVYEEEPTDTRTCSGSCSCQAPQGGACAGSVTVKDGSCAGATVGALTLGQACTDLSSAVVTSGLSLAATVSGAGACTPNHKTESGGLEGALHTLCCTEGL